jgi:hypothetical protein
MWKNLASALNEGFKEIGAAALEEVGATYYTSYGIKYESGVCQRLRELGQVEWCLTH